MIYLDYIQSGKIVQVQCKRMRLYKPLENYNIDSIHGFLQIMSFAGARFQQKSISAFFQT